MDAYPVNSISHPTDELEMAIDAQVRKPSVVGSVEKPVVMERTWGLAARVDPTVTYEEYIYWAKIEREIEKEEEIKFRAEHGKFPLMDLIKGKLSSEGRARQKREKEERAAEQDEEHTEIVGEGEHLGLARHLLVDGRHRPPLGGEGVGAAPAVVLGPGGQARHGLGIERIDV